MSTQERTISISTNTILRVIISALVLAFLWAIRDIVALVFVALVLAAVMTPFVNKLKTYKVPPAISAIIFYILLFGVFTFAFILIVPQLIDQVSKVASVFGGESFQFVHALETTLQILKNFIEQYGLEQNLQAGLGSIQEHIPQLTRDVFGFMVSIFGGIVNFVIVFVLAFYMVVEEEEAMRWFKNLIPEEYQHFSTNLIVQVQKKFGRWLIGQLTLSLVIGTLYYIGLLILGVEGALFLGIFAAFAEFIPYVGPIITGILIVLVALSQQPVLAILAFILMILVQQLENNVLCPKIMQKVVGLNPVISIIAFLVGAKLFGPVGMILAIPVATAISVVIMEYIQFQKNVTA